VLVDSDHCKAVCEGSVTFYYTEKGEERIENMRNYGLLEEKLEEKGYEGYDLFEKTFENDSLTFSEFSNLIEQQLKS